MMNNHTKNSLERLQTNKKIVTILLVITSIVIVLYGAYFIAALMSETWQANNTMGIVGLGILVVLIANLSLRLTIIQKKIKEYKE
jgi:uncharacterized membrane protein